METKHWHELAAELRPVIDRIPGLDGEYLAYLVDAVDARNGADIDEYRALAAFARQARGIADGIGKHATRAACRIAGI